MLSPLESQFIIARKGELKDVSGRMIPGTRWPMFPGGQFGGSIAEIRELIKRQKRAQGVVYTTAANTSITVQIPVSATARMLLGYRVMRNDVSDKGTLMINNEVVVENTLCSFHNPLSMLRTQEYVPIPRPLSGQDSILFRVEAIVSSLGIVEVFYL